MFEFRERQRFGSILRFPESAYRDVAYVREQCALLAQQLAEMK
jgi:hypothetical protein